MWNTVFDALTAFGTVGACVISLALAYGRRRHNLDCVFIWGTPNDYKPTLLVNNLCSRTIVINKIDIAYDKKTVASFDIMSDSNLRNYAIISADQEKRIFFKAGDFDFHDIMNYESPDRNKRKTMKITVLTTSGKKFVSKQKYSNAEIEELIFGYELLRDD